MDIFFSLGKNFIKLNHESNICHYFFVTLIQINILAIFVLLRLVFVMFSEKNRKIVIFMKGQQFEIERFKDLCGINLKRQMLNIEICILNLKRG